MPQRFIGLLTAVAGLATVLLLAMAGVKLHRAAATGPRWKRKLVTAGLLVLAMLGVSAGGTPVRAASESAAVPAKKVEARDLLLADEWVSIVSVWREASEVGSGRRGRYPFNRAGKEKLLAELEKTGDAIDALGKAGLLTASECGLLKVDLERLIGEVKSKRPDEMRSATCYVRLVIPPAMLSAHRLEKRLPLLEKLAEAETLSPAAVARILVAVDEDVNVIRNNGGVEERDAAVLLKVMAAVNRIKARVRGTEADLSAMAEWECITLAWHEATPYAESGKSSTVQRRAADVKLALAVAAARRLAAKGILPEAQADLLVSEARLLTKRMYSTPATDVTVTCYARGLGVPPPASIERVKTRLPLLKKAAENGALDARVLRTLLPAIEADIEELSSDQKLGMLMDDEYKRVVVLREETRRIVKQIRASLAKTDGAEADAPGE